MADQISSSITRFSKLQQALSKSGFEARFSSVQRGLLQQMQNEKQKVIDDGDEQKVAALQKKRDAIFAKVDTLRDTLTQLQTNSYRLLDVNDMANSAVNAANEDGNDELSADEAAALNTAKDKILDELYKIHGFSPNDGLTDGNIANRFRQIAETLSSFTAVAGPVDPSGTETPTNDNRALMDALSSLAERAATDAESTSYLVEGTNSLIVATNKKAYDTEADLAELTSASLARKQGELDDIEVRYSNLIRTISLAFEVQSGLGDMLAQGNVYKPEKGSILNMFT